MTDNLRHFIESYITDGLTRGWADFVLLLVAVVIAAATYYLAKWALVVIEKIIARSPTRWDDDLLNNSMLRAVAQLAPALSVKYLLPSFFDGKPGMHAWCLTLTSLYILWAVVHIVTIFLGNLYNGMAARENTRAYAVKGIFQMLKLVAIGIGVIIGLSIVIGKAPTAILTAIGASAAVLMLVFKDTILGLVASIQLSANKMVHRGDWIVAEKHNANGEVEDVSLTTVKVRNWDNSITTIPPYSLVSESFRNYEAMRLSGGRRVDRSILIDMNSVRYCTGAELEELSRKGFIDDADMAEAEHVVNLRLLRDWLERFLMADSRVNTKMLLMVRQMEPTPTGLPVQLYFFTKATEWKKFEHVQSDIMCHVYASVQAFGLRIFQSPAGSDIERIGAKD